MSGGHWNYFSRELLGLCDSLEKAKRTVELLANIEHELDWGYSCDTCLPCAEKRVLKALAVYFDTESAFDPGHESAAAVLADRFENQCPKCREHYQQYGARMHALREQGESWTYIASKLVWNKEAARRFYEQHWLKWQ